MFVWCVTNVECLPVPHTRSRSFVPAVPLERGATGARSGTVSLFCMLDWDATLPLRCA
jgi:hypothetical protein